MKTKLYFNLNGIRDVVISPNAAFVIAGFLIMALSDIFSGVRWSGLMYVDEVFCAGCAVLLVVNVIKRRRISRLFFFPVLLVLLGLSGNIFFDVQPDLGIAVTDAFIFCKPFILMFYVLTTVTDVQARTVYECLMIFAKLILWVFFISSAVSAFTDSYMLGVRGEFAFLSGFGGTVSMWTILAFAIVASRKSNPRILYYLFSAFIIYCADSGLGTLSIIGFVAIYWFMEKHSKFKWHYLLVIVPVCLWVGRNEITGYLLDRNAPRFLLPYFAVVTAREYFPLGAGFATYCSTMAKSHYSKLYYQYGFNYRYKMSAEDPGYLMDSYYPQIVGQLGFFGGVIFVMLLYKIFKMILGIGDKYIRNGSLYLYATWLIAGLGFGISSSWGCCVYILLPLFYLIGNNCKRGGGKEAEYEKHTV